MKMTIRANAIDPTTANFILQLIALGIQVAIEIIHDINATTISVANF